MQQAAEDDLLLSLSQLQMSLLEVLHFKLSYKNLMICSKVLVAGKNKSEWDTILFT